MGWEFFFTMNIAMVARGGRSERSKSFSQPYTINVFLEDLVGFGGWEWCTESCSPGPGEIGGLTIEYDHNKIQGRGM